jgi:Ca-activated chloride channel family protein
MRSLSEQASGSFYFLEDPAAVKEVFHEEVTSFLIPLAADVKLDVDIGDAYVLRGHLRDQAVRGVGGPGHDRHPEPAAGAPHRVDDHEDGGRRGGGGAILLELLRRQGQSPTQGVGSLKLRYRVPNSDEYVDEKVEIQVPVAPGDVDLENGTFEHVSVEKGFVMLNIYMGFQMAATRASQGDYDGAWNVLDALDQRVNGWLAANPDFDIEDDLAYIRKFKTNVQAKRPPDGQPTPTPTPEPWPYD